MEILSNQNILFYLASYLIGSIPFGYILAKLFADVDIKREGSGNIGATNVLRVLKKRDPQLAKKLGAATLFLDAVKGALLLLLAKMAGMDVQILWTIAILSVWGHCFSLFLGFEGGKGVATGLGVFAVMLPYSTLISFLAWFIFAKIVKISSLASTMALITLVLSSYFISSPLTDLQTHAPVWIIAATIVYKHIPNYVRLFKKTEIAV